MSLEQAHRTRLLLLQKRRSRRPGLRAPPALLAWIKAGRPALPCAVLPCRLGPTPHTTWLSFDVDFAFKSPLYRHVASVFFEEVRRRAGCRRPLVRWAADTLVRLPRRSRRQSAPCA